VLSDPLTITRLAPPGYATRAAAPSETRQHHRRDREHDERHPRLRTSAITAFISPISFTRIYIGQLAGCAPTASTE